MTNCRVEGCDQRADHASGGRRGYCSKHYARVKVHGDPDVVHTRGRKGQGYIPESADGSCAIEGCDRSSAYQDHGRAGLCAAHYKRSRAHGDPLVTRGQTQTEVGALALNPNGRTARGYGWRHQKLRAEWDKKVQAGQVCCARCGFWIAPGTEWHLDHTADRTGYLGPSHARCNVVAANKSRRRRPAPSWRSWL